MGTRTLKECITCIKWCHVTGARVYVVLDLLYGVCVCEDSIGPETLGHCMHCRHLPSDTGKGEFDFEARLTSTQLSIITFCSSTRRIYLPL